MSNVDECRAYVVHLRIEHRELHGALQRIKHGWTDANAEYDLPIVVQELRDLRTRLAEHFAEEEGGGCMEEAVGRCPRLGQEADRIEREHPALLAELDEIIARTQLALELGQTNQNHQTFRDFAQKLFAHESAENHILEVAFGLHEDL